jgi:hypothetical protein
MSGEYSADSPRGQPGGILGLAGNAIGLYAGDKSHERILNPDTILKDVQLK